VQIDFDALYWLLYNEYGKKLLIGCETTKMNISYQIERLLSFAVENSVIENTDINYTRNILLGMLAVSKPYEGAAICNNENVDRILSEILDYCASSSIIPNNSPTSRGLMSAMIMGAITARPSEIISKFMALMSQSPEKATDWFYHLNRSVEYIQSNSLKRSHHWKHSTPFGIMEITINVAKPEKTAEEIELARKSPPNDYPKCVLCPENEGYFGRFNHPARQNLRLIPLILNGEEWFFQYSPYVYYNEHCIVLKKEHTPMNVTPETFTRLFDFLAFLPHYFIGSNAGLPVVGGSILSHDHYQGGRYVFPLQKANCYKKYLHPKWPEVSVALVKWPMSVIRLSGKGKSDILSLATLILNNWTVYDDETAGIYSRTNETVHNAITIIARVNTDGMYELDIVLRNNRTTDEFPLGIFHPHQELHHIKQENIGLIEVMGLAILPARLEAETEKIAEILTGAIPVDDSGILDKHSNWINYLVGRWGTKNTQSDAELIIRDEIGVKFTQVLSDAGVFKYTDEGRRQFSRFVESCRMREAYL